MRRGGRVVGEGEATPPFDSIRSVSRSSTMLLALFVTSRRNRFSIGWYTYRTVSVSMKVCCLLPAPAVGVRAWSRAEHGHDDNVSWTSSPGQGKARQGNIFATRSTAAATPCCYDCSGNHNNSTIFTTTTNDYYYGGP